MKPFFRKIPLVPLSLLALAFSSCSVEPEQLPQPNPATANVEKQVNFNIYTTEDYRHPHWENSRVQVRVVIRKNTLIPDYQEAVVLDSTLAWINFKDIPQFAEKIQISKAIVYNPDKESLSVGYSRVFDDNGYIQTSGVSYYLERDRHEKNIDVTL